MSGGGNEILRAILSKNAKFKSQQFYSVELVVPAVPPPVMLATTTAKISKFFLVMGVAPYVLSAGINITATNQAQFNIYSQTSTRRWSFIPDVCSNWGRSISFDAGFDTYMLFEPNEDISVEFGSEGVTPGQTLGVTFYGIEFGM